MAKKLIGFRVEEGKWEAFHLLAEDAGYSVQKILADYVEACLRAKSVEVMPVLGEKSGRLRASNLRLRNTIQHLQGCMNQKNFNSAEEEFYDLMDQMKVVNDASLLEEAEAVATVYLKWINEHKLESGGYKPERF